ncbi:uncharacterized protein LOC142928903 [Petromyzon marinus]|uniref:uncharacterized protein LOC142928903 n=1 Tax=Petromyzon marinus TaxID=7757 RepID=UPI003F6FD1CF
MLSQRTWLVCLLLLLPLLLLLLLLSPGMEVDPPLASLPVTMPPPLVASGVWRPHSLLTAIWRWGSSTAWLSWLSVTIQDFHLWLTVSQCASCTRSCNVIVFVTSLAGISLGLLACCLYFLQRRTVPDPMVLMQERHFFHHGGHGDGIFVFLDEEEQGEQEERGGGMVVHPDRDFGDLVRFQQNAGDLRWMEPFPWDEDDEELILLWDD